MSGGFSFGGGGAGAMGRLVVIVGARPGTPPDASRLSERPSSIEEAIKSLSEKREVDDLRRCPKKPRITPGSSPGSGRVVSNPSL